MQSQTILVVDDETGALDFCCAVLSGQGYRTLRAAGGREALEVHASEAPIDLALVDVVMPGMSGIDLVKRLEAHETPPRIALISGYTQDEVERLIGAEGSRYRIFWKPFEIGVFLQMIRNVLDTPQREAAFSAGRWTNTRGWHSVRAT